MTAAPRHSRCLDNFHRHTGVLKPLPLLPDALSLLTREWADPESTNATLEEELMVAMQYGEDGEEDGDDDDEDMTGFMGESHGPPKCDSTLLT